MASGVLSGVLAATLLLSLGLSAHGTGGGNKGGHGHGKPPDKGGQCYVSPPEIECIHLVLELLLKVSVHDYFQRTPHAKSQAPWFDAFKHVSFPRNRCIDYSLSLLSSIDIRESLTYCVSTYSNETCSYVPPSPKQMYKDMCAENNRIRGEVQSQ